LLWEHGGFVEPLLRIPTPHGAIYADAAGWPQKNGKAPALHSQNEGCQEPAL
jgi:hypothetical protein